MNKKQTKKTIQTKLSSCAMIATSSFPLINRLGGDKCGRQIVPRQDNTVGKEEFSIIRPVTGCFQFQIVTSSSVIMRKGEKML